MTFVDRVKLKILGASSISSFYIGCDSSVYTDRNGRKQAKYILMFITHYDSNKGGGWLKEEYILPEFGNLKQRLLTEANYAIGLGIEVINLVGTRKLEIHFDINPDPRHKSHVAVKEALAYAKGVGLTPKIKPDSFAASHAADQLT